jgi:hypothetical protein
MITHSNIKLFSLLLRFSAGFSKSMWEKQIELPLIEFKASAEAYIKEFT